MNYYQEVLKKGFCLIKQAVNKNDIEEVHNTIIMEMANQGYAKLLRNLTIPLSISSDLANSSITQLPSALGAMPAIRKSSVFSQIEECMREVFATAVRKTADSLIIKLANDSSGSPWHQDSAYDTYHPIDLRRISVWLPLTSDSPPLSYIEATSLERKLTHKSVQNIYYLPEEQVQELIPKKVTPIFSVGDLLIHHRNVIHRGEPNASKKEQYVITFNYEAIE